MTSFIWAYLATLPVLAVLDISWVGFIAKSFYQSKLSHLLSGSLAWQPAMVWYLVYLFGLFYFVIAPGKALSDVAISGALFGLVAYATYDLVNMATLPQWPLSITLVDILWGAALGAAVSCAGYVLLGLFSN